MRNVIVRMWTAEGYHKDVAILDEDQVRCYDNRGVRESPVHYYTRPLNGVRLVIDPKEFPEAIEFEVIVERE